MLDSASWPLLILFAVLMAIAPWPMGPEPHLIEKLRMLTQGTLRKPIDIFDLLLHSAPIVFIIAKAWKDFGSA
ncbi:MAG: hypothetical protein HZA03_12315 [Nitrospinae bacterium]|nr:hypothetical protein [Nitrospinota bacterium]